MRHHGEEKVNVPLFIHFTTTSDQGEWEKRKEKKEKEGSTASFPALVLRMGEGIQKPPLRAIFLVPLITWGRHPVRQEKRRGKGVWSLNLFSSLPGKKEGIHHPSHIPGR